MEDDDDIPYPMGGIRKENLLTWGIRNNDSI